MNKIFSVTNEKSKKNKWYKVIYILGIKLSFRNKKKEKKVAEEKERKELKATLNLLKKQNKELKSELKKTKKEYKAEFKELENEYRYKLHKYCAKEMRPVAIKDWYFEKTGEELNLDNPQTYNEKMQWIKLYNSTPIKTKLADKYLVRDWVKEKIGEEYLVPLLGVWDKFDEIDFDKLPDKFVLKCNHGCGYNIIVKDKTNFDIEEARKNINKWMHEDYAFKEGFEMHYSPIPRKIIAEKYIGDGVNELVNYRIWCFNGKVHYIKHLIGKKNQAIITHLDKNWNEQNFICPHYQLNEDYIGKPKQLDRLIELAEILSKEFNHVRVDFNVTPEGYIKFSEMTFTSGTGLTRFDSKEQRLKFGNLMQLPNKDEKFVI